MKSVTVWNCNGEFNHVEDGYDLERKEPTAVNADQKKNWRGSKWEAVEGIMSDNYEVTVKK